MPAAQKTPAQRALVTLRKFLDAAGVKHEPSKTADLAIITPKGKRDVVIAIEPVDPTRNVLAIEAKALNGRKLQVAVDAFTSLTTAAGLGAISPVPNRGEAPTQKLHFAEHFDEVAMRHTEFRKSPNLPEAKVKQFMPIIERLARSFYARNRLTLDTFGYGADDLTTFGMVWLHNYFGVHRKPNHKHIDDVRLFTQYMKQRQVEFLDLIRKKSRNVLPEDDTLATALYSGKPTAESLGAARASFMDGADPALDVIDVGPAEQVTSRNNLAMTGTRVTHTTKKVGYHKFEHEMRVAPRGRNVTPFFDDPRVEVEPDEAYVNAHTSLDTSSDAKRRKSANALLEKGLAEMDHEKLLLTLTSVIDGRAFCDDTRREAVRRLSAHVEKCSRPECLSKRGTLVERDEEGAGAEA